MSHEPAPPKTVAVAGSGTMGTGIAQLACLAGATTLLHDPDEAALARASKRLRDDLQRGAARGRWSQEDADRAAERLQAASTLEALHGAEVVIEAAPERLELKQELFTRLADGIVPETCVLATNTSSLLVTAIAAPVPHPERVVGMHFFNPPPLMPLVEVVAGAESSAPALATARATGTAMGKRVIDAIDGPGFLVNRCNRPFGLEALRLLQERIAPVEEIDRICRLGGGFRMGPFELMDLVGIDVGLEIARSFYEQSFGEPRWRPSPIATKMVAAGRTGRKAQRGYYDYRAGKHREDDPPAPQAGGGGGRPVVIAGRGALADQLREAAARAGWSILELAPGNGEPPAFLTLELEAGALSPSPPDTPAAPAAPGPRALCCAGGSLGRLDPGGTAVGFHALPPLSASTLVELTRGPATSPEAVNTCEALFATLGLRTAWVGDAPGLVLGRIVCQVINEAAFALAEGVGTAADIDAGMQLGLSYPRGVLAWADAIGPPHVLRVLDALHSELGEDRYRAAPLLRQLVRTGARFT